MGSTTQAHDSDASKNELLRAMDLRLNALREELTTAFAQAAVSKHSLEELVDVVMFSQHLGSTGMSDSLCKHIGQRHGAHVVGNLILANISQIINLGNIRVLGHLSLPTAALFNVSLSRAEMENEANSPSSICLQNSEWMAENIKGLDQTVKEMLLLVENDGILSVEKPHDNGLMQPELIARVKEISHRHHLLADHYNKLTGGLSSYIQSANEVKNFEKSNSQLDHRFKHQIRSSCIALLVLIYSIDERIATPLPMVDYYVFLDTLAL